jgi:2-oxoglutarate dehydrogenase E1 component
MIGDTHFERYIPDSHPEHLVPAEEVRRHILCTGMLHRRFNC